MSGFGLSALFSDAGKEKFTRLLKPEEFVSRKRPDGEPRPDAVDPLDEERQRSKEDKRKLKRAKRYTVKEEGEASTSATTARAGTSSSGSGGKGEAEVEAETDADAGADAEAAEAGVADVAQRTIFVGNVPLGADNDLKKAQDKIRKFCERFGPVASVRARSLPIEGTAVDDAGNQTLVRKVCAMTSKLGAQKGSLNAYVVFKDISSVAAALRENNTVMESRHLRIDHAKPSVFNPSLTVFLGGLPLYADEEEVRTYFAEHMPNKHDDIDGIRLIRDADSMVGKGIGYLLLNNSDAVMKALSLHQVAFKKRWVLRVQTCAKRTKNFDPKARARNAAAPAADASADPATAAAAATVGGSAAAIPGEAAAGKRKLGAKDAADSSSSPKKKRRKDKNPIQPGAMKRINLKNTMTRKKVLVEKGQKKEKGRRGKRLGGNVKKAMKAAKG